MYILHHHVGIGDDPQKAFNFCSMKDFHPSVASFNNRSLTTFSASTVPQLNAIPSQQQLELNHIPPPRELDLNAIAKPDGIKLEEIRVPPVASLAGSSIKVPTSKEQLIELVAANGDGYEENLITQFNKNDLSQTIR